jgi:dipeptide/tripeptide permease
VNSFPLAKTMFDGTVLLQIVGPFQKRATSNSPSDFWLTLPIFATECAERFNFYGFTALLTLYFQQHLQYATQQAAANFNFFQAVCYCTPLLGSWLADQYLGKYRTIVYFTLLYLFGQLLLPISALLSAEATWTKVLTFLSLFLIALGTGGIKPCVSAFGAEQVEWRHKLHRTGGILELKNVVSSEQPFSKNFEVESSSLQDNEDERELMVERVSNGHSNVRQGSVASSLVTSVYFARFYLFINIGAIAGQLICPWVKQFFGWCGAFFVSAFVLLLALVIFLSGMHVMGYIHIQKTYRTSLHHSVRNNTATLLSSSYPTNDQNIHRGRRTQEEWHSILRVTLLLSPIAVFWMCWSQQGATWIQQLSLMEMPRIFQKQMNPAQWAAWNPFSTLQYNDYIVYFR